MPCKSRVILTFVYLWIGFQTSRPKHTTNQYLLNYLAHSVHMDLIVTVEKQCNLTDW